MKLDNQEKNLKYEMDQWTDCCIKQQTLDHYTIKDSNRNNKVKKKNTKG
jgi:hypothetical protein